MNIEKKIELILPYLIRNNSDKFESGEVTIKFSGDGTNICRGGVYNKIFIRAIIK